MYSNFRVVYLIFAACLCMPCKVSFGLTQIGTPPAIPSADSEQVNDQEARDATEPFVYEWKTPTDQFIQDTPLAELALWIQTQWGDAASADHIQRGMSSDVVLVDRSKHPLTDHQWVVLLNRVVDGIRKTNGDQLSGAYRAATLLPQKIEDNPHFDIHKVDTAWESRLFDSDAITAKLAAGALFNTNNKLSTDEEASNRVILLLTAIDQAKPGDARASMVLALQGLSNTLGYAGHDTEVLKLMHKILESPNLTIRERINAFNAVGSAKGDMHEAAQTAAKGLESIDNVTRNLSLSTLKRLCSNYENANPVSSQLALAVALPAITKLFRENPTDHTAQSIMDLCSHVGKHAAIWVPDIIPYLDHIDTNIQGSAIWALTQIGPDASDALPKLRSMNGTSGNLNESVRDELYLIAKEGAKPVWYDSHIERLKEAGTEID